MVKATTFLQALLGNWHTDHFLIGILDDQARADDAAAALREAGWKDENFKLFHGEAAIDTAEEHPQAAEAQQGLAKRFAMTVRELSSNESDLAKDVEEALRAGHSLLAIYTPDGEREERAQEIMQSHDAHHVECFGSWTITDVRKEEDITKEATSF